MKKNVGVADRIIRFLAAILLIDMAAGKLLFGNWNIVAWVVSAVLMLTALVGTCPLYSLFGINSRSSKNISH